MLTRVVYHRLYVSLRSREEIILLQEIIHLNEAILAREVILLRGKIRSQEIILHREIMLLLNKVTVHLLHQEETLPRAKQVKRPIATEEHPQDTVVETINGVAKPEVEKIITNHLVS